MSTDQVLILIILALTLGLFLLGRWRHDLVALAALLAAVLAGLVPSEQAFAGFGHPAVITVACVLVLSRGLQVTGAVEALTRYLLPAKGGIFLSLTVLVVLGAAFSAFMNNVGALALLMPVALQVARRTGVAPGRVLMPLSFGTILGGMTTLIGTPPNLIVAGFRERSGNAAFAMFDFAPVGLAVALAGIAFVALIGWRLVPARHSPEAEGFDPGAYLTELRVAEGAKAVGMTLGELETAAQASGMQIVALVRNDVYLSAPRSNRLIHADDILVVEADVNALIDLVGPLGLSIAAKPPAAPSGDEVPTDEPQPTARRAAPDDLLLREYVVRPDSPIAGSTAADLALRSRYGVNLLAASRGGTRSASRLRAWRIRSGDVMLLQGHAESLAAFAQDARFIPLAERDLRLPSPRKAVAALAIMAGAVTLAALNILRPEIAFALGVLLTMALRTVPLRDIYDSVDWPVIVLLAALMPVANAMETTGAARLVADILMNTLAQGSPVIAIALVLVVTMTLSDVMNNAATAAVMCPIAIGAAAVFGVSADSFLMAVAIGASCAFLTPIGHQNNTLILGPGGFRFGDYWRMGLPLELIVVAVSLPVLLVVWPL